MESITTALIHRSSKLGDAVNAKKYNMRRVIFGISKNTRAKTGNSCSGRAISGVFPSLNMKSGRVLKLLFSSELILTVVDDIITENNQNEASLS